MMSYPEAPAPMLTGDCPLTFSLATSGPLYCTHLLGTRGLPPALPLWGCLVLSEAGPGPWRGMLCSCSAVLLTLMPGPEPGDVGQHPDGVVTSAICCPVFAGNRNWGVQRAGQLWAERTPEERSPGA